jgi:hypothetical protein
MPLCPETKGVFEYSQHIKKMFILQWNVCTFGPFGLCAAAYRGICVPMDYLLLWIYLGLHGYVFNICMDWEVKVL